MVPLYLKALVFLNKSVQYQQVILVFHWLPRGCHPAPFLPAWHPLCDTADEELRVSVDEQLGSPRSHCLPDCHNTCLDLCYIVARLLKLRGCSAPHQTPTP